MDRTRKEYIEWIVSLPLLILDDLGMRKLPLSAAEDLLEIIMRRYERASTLVTSNIWSDWSGRVSGVASFLLAVSAVYYEWMPSNRKLVFGEHRDKLFQILWHLDLDDTRAPRAKSALVSMAGCFPLVCA